MPLSMIKRIGEAEIRPTRRRMWDANRALDFEIMCDASDYVVGTILGQRKNKICHVIHYESKVLNKAQINYATTEK